MSEAVTPERVWWAVVDKYNLDTECAQHTDVVEDTARRLAVAKRDLALEKMKVKGLRAELDQQIRENPNDYGLAKVTEASLATTIEGQRPYKQALRALIDLEYEVNLLDGYMTALEHRKKMIEDLVFLHGQGYYGKPSEERVRPAGVKRRAN